MDGCLPNLPELLQSSADLPEQKPGQEVVPTEVLCQRIIHLQICGAGRSHFIITDWIKQETKLTEGNEATINPSESEHLIQYKFDQNLETRERPGRQPIIMKQKQTEGQAQVFRFD